MNYAKHRKAIEKLYDAAATISRHASVKDPISKETTLQPAPIYTDQPCRISQKALGQNDQTEAQNEIRYETKLFIAPELVIKQGDRVVVTRGSITQSYVAGEPFPYPTHQEVSIQRKEWA